MSANTAIEWADHTFNPWTGCTAVSPACDHCYAEAWAKRAGRDFFVRQRTKTWGDPVKWNDQHQEFFAVHGRRQRVFCASLADVFDNQVDPQWRIDLLELIAACPNLDWLLLTKRIGNAESLLDEALNVMSHGVTWWRDMPWPNVWIGATVCNQTEANRDIPKLLSTPAAMRFLSIEPMLGPISLAACWRSAGCGWGDDDDRAASHCFGCGGLGGFQHERCAWPSQKIDWVICGGESGPKARPMHPDWARSLRDQCASAGVPFLFKQWGAWEIASEDNGHFDHDMARNAAVWIDIDGTTAKPSCTGMRNPYGMVKVGKKAAGRLLDGIEHNGFPGD